MGGGALIFGLLALHCSLEGDGSPVATSDAGREDGGVDAGGEDARGEPDTGPVEAGGDEDAAPELRCAAGKPGPSMVPVEHARGAFCVDATEVTQGSTTRS